MDKICAAAARSVRPGRQQLLLALGGMAVVLQLVALVQLCQASVQRGERVRAELRNETSVRSTP